MNKRGVTIIELLASVIIFSLMVSLVAVVISLINNASDRIEINSRANYEGLFLDREIKDALLEFSPTEYISCGTDCIIFQKEFLYEFDPILDDIVLTTYSPALTHRIEILNGQILVNSVPLVIDYFTLGSGSKIELLENLTQAYFIITIELVPENGKTFTFSTSYSFAIQTIPTG